MCMERSQEYRLLDDTCKADYICKLFLEQIASAKEEHIKIGNVLLSNGWIPINIYPSGGWYPIKKPLVAI